MAEVDELRREIEELRRQLAETQQALDAVARGEVDAVARAESSTPLLLHAAQEKLRDSQSLLRAVFDGALDALLLTDDERRIVDANAAACELIGVPRQQLVGRRTDEFAAPGFDSDGRFRTLIEHGRARGQFTIHRPDTATRVVEYSDVANVAPGLHLAAWRDATDRVTAESSLRRSEARFRAMVEKSQDGITLLRQDVRSMYQSPAVERLLGYTLEESQQIAWSDFVDEDQRPKLAAALAEIMTGPGASASLDFRIRRRDGTQRWLQLTATNWLEDSNIGAIVANFHDVTERRTLREELERFFELSLDMLCIAGNDGRFRRLNPAWQLTLGWSLEELCDRPWLDFVHPDDRAATLEVGAGLAAGIAAVNFENRYQCKDGSFRRVQWAAIQAPNNLIYACAHDVTAERAAADRDRLLFAASPLPIWLLDAHTLQFLDSNDAAVQAYGYTREELLARTLYDVAVEEQHGGLDELRTSDKRSAILVSDRLHRTKSGELRVVQVTAHRLEVDGLATILAVIVDMTEAKRLEEERAHHLERLRLLEMCVSRLNDIVLITSAHLSEPGPEIVYVNEAFSRITGYSRDEVIGRTPRMLQGPETDLAAAANLRAALGRSEPQRIELVNYTKAGTPYWIELDISPVSDESGTVTHFVAVERDVTEHRRHQEIQARLASIVASSQDAIISRGVDGVILTWNHAAEKLTMYSATEAIGRSISMLSSPDDAARLSGERAGGDDHVEPLDRFEMVMVRKDGSLVDVSLTTSVLTDVDGKVIGASIIARDISERRKAEAALRKTEDQLRQSLKMEAVGSLAGGVAHDFNNLLSVILSFTDMILEDLPPADPTRGDLEEVQKAGRRASELTSQLLAFSRKQILRPVVLDLNEVVRGVQKMLGRMLGEDIELSLLTAARVGKIHADAGQIGQVIMNLVVNARDAMPTGGKLTIETSNVVLDDSYAADHIGVVPGPYVMLAVTDTGIGMDPETQTRIFEPFFTTKPKEKGTGLGLSTVYGIVQQSGGHIWLYSELGKGTAFKIYLPRNDLSLVTQNIPIVDPASLRGNETILLVEDDAAVRNSIQSILRRSGYNVLEANNAGEAFLVCEQFTAQIDLLLTDVVMPRMSGRQLAERLVQQRPDLKILFISGYTEETIVHHGILDAGIEFVPKPITPNALLKKVRQVLDGGLRRLPAT